MTAGPAMEQQAWILRRLLDELYTLEVEADDQEASNGITAEFARLRSQSAKYRTDKTLPTKSAEKSENIKKNRYKDILPFDHSRVKLTFTISKNDSDYINANFIKGVSGSRAYIATQGPLPHTVLDFLRMLWEYNIKIVVMACREFEMGKKKCECYWPKKEEEPFVCEPFSIYCDSEENKGDYVTRMLRMTYNNCSRTMKQLHYVNWPDHGVPDSIPPILDMLEEMRAYQEHDNTPICIHCSAGCGRTGALCVIDYTWNLLKKQLISSHFSIYDLVQNMRTQRSSVVQTKEQYVLVYRTIKLLFERYLHSVDALEQTKKVELDELTVLPPTVATEIDSEKYHLNEDLKDLDIQLQHLLENRVFLHNETETNQHQWSLPQEYPGDLQVTSFCSETPQTTSEQSLQTHSEPGPGEKPESESILQRQASTAAICLMVEDPYFDSPVEESAENQGPACGTPSLSLNNKPIDVFMFNDTGTLEAHTDDEAAPPLPERTPESFELAENAEPCTSLAVVILPNAAAAAVRELQGSPPSPVPPLPERTPESFELADPAPAKESVEATPPVNLNLLGISSEWSGSSGASVNHNETKSWVRSKSLKAKMTFSEFSQSKHTSNTNSKPLHCRPLEPPPLPPQPHGEKMHPLPDRRPGSPALTPDNIHGKGGPGPQPLQTAQPTLRVGIANEWDGAPQSKKFLDVVMHRSKSARAKISFREPLTVSPPPAEACANEGPGNDLEGAHVVNCRPSLNAEMPESKADKSNEKGFSRSKSLKFFRSKQKTKVEPSTSQPSTPPPSYGPSSSLFRFGFGTRFGKPKGPRTYPETWL